jgi:hypothetical protein
MAISRLAISNPSATTDTLLHTATRSSLASIIATNKASAVAEVRVWIVPQGQDGTPENWSYIAYDADITATNSLETFRFPVMTGDKIYVRSTTADVSFQIMGIYETGADTYVYAQATEPTAPQVGDIWVDTASDVPSIDNTTVYRWSKTAVGGETSLSGTGNDLSILKYIAGYEQVYLNGVLLAKDLDYFATNGTSITSLTALSAGDIVEVISPYAIELTDVYTKSVSDARYSTLARQGMFNVVPSGVAVATGTGTILANGQINFSSASSISINNCFSSIYDNYKIIFKSSLNMPSNGANELRVRLRTASGDDSTNFYNGGYSHFYYGGTTVPISGGVQPGTYLPINTAFYNTSIASATFDVMGINGTGNREFYGISQGGGGASGSFGTFAGGTYITSSVHTGITFYSSSTGTFSGTIRIYGYNNGGA